MSEKAVILKYEDLEAAVKHYLADVENSPVDPKTLGSCLRVVPREGQVAIIFADAPGGKS